MCVAIMVLETITAVVDFLIRGRQSPIYLSLLAEFGIIKLVFVIIHTAALMSWNTQFSIYSDAFSIMCRRDKFTINGRKVRKLLLSSSLWNRTYLNEIHHPNNNPLSIIFQIPVDRHHETNPCLHRQLANGSNLIQRIHINHFRNVQRKWHKAPFHALQDLYLLLVMLSHCFLGRPGDSVLRHRLMVSSCKS